MSTINISLPAEQVSFIDNLVSQFGFANRSELVRAIFRFVKHEPATFSKVATFPLLPPSTRSRSKIMQDFKASGLYNAGFLKDLKAGLKRSDYFTK